VGEQRGDEISYTTRFEVTKFDGSNFPLWQSRVKDLLGRTIKVDAVKPNKMDVEDSAELQIRTVGTIQLSLSDQVLYHVMDMKSLSDI
jgi:hypothetical protein